MTSDGGNSDLSRCDVFVAGGGPAGAATALSLRSHAPALSVVLCEASSHDSPALGEHLPAVARGLLAHLGVWTGFVREGFISAPSTTAAWGRPSPRIEHSIFSARGPGWHLDRARFDGFLLSAAAERGAHVVRPAHPTATSRGADAWTVRLSDGSRWSARFLVDATGRRASLGRRVGARMVAYDRLVGVGRYFPHEDELAHGTLVEAFEDGWWYSALAGARRVVACMTDSDIAKDLRLMDGDRWLALIARTSILSRIVGSAAPLDAPIVRAASSARLDPVCARDWLAVGDAASAFDPLSSQGIVKALRSGIFASYAIADALVRGNARGLDRYATLLGSEFDAYRETHARMLAEEERWPERPFWARRRAGSNDTQEAVMGRRGA